MQEKNIKQFLQKMQNLIKSLLKKATSVICFSNISLSKNVILCFCRKEQKTVLIKLQKNF